MLVAQRKADQNQAVLDPWTVVHYASGLAAGFAGVNYRTAIIAAVGYELAEQVFERTEFGQSFFNVSGPERGANAIVDVIVFAWGYKAGERWNRTT